MPMMVIPVNSLVLGSKLSIKRGGFHAVEGKIVDGGFAFTFLEGVT